MTTPFPETLDRARAGDTEAQEELMRDYLPGLRAFVRLRSGGLLRQMESCSDLVQTVCRSVLTDLAAVKCRDEPAFKAWLYTVAHNKLVKKAQFHRAEQRDAQRVDADATVLDAYGTFCTPSQHAGVREEIGRVESAFDRMPDDYREVILEACVLGKPHREVAASMERSEEAVRSLLQRARARLALLLRDGGQG